MVTGTILKNLYQDSVKLMLLSQKIKSTDKVDEVAVVMGTPTNLEILKIANLEFKEMKKATPNDIIIVVKCDDEATGETIIANIIEELKGNTITDIGTQSGNKSKFANSIQGAKNRLIDANIVLISVPGKYAYSLADEALDLGITPMIFSDNVTEDEERILKLKALKKNMIVMGPDCGTTVLDGSCLGFGNVIRKGEIGIVGASGTGIQEISSLIHKWGGGISHAIGVGGRDLKKSIGGLSMKKGIELLGEDEDTEILVIVAKPGDPEVTKEVVDKAILTKKPTVFCFVGTEIQANQDKYLVFSDTLESAAEQALQIAGIKFNKRNPPKIKTQHPVGYIRGLFTGGTLAYEALYIMKRLSGVHSNILMDGVTQLDYPIISKEHTIIDLGDDYYTKGRAHPIIDPEIRNRLIIREAQSPATRVIMLDYILGYGCNGDPVGMSAESIAKAKKIASDKGRELCFFAHVCGTDEDPQSLEIQEKKLEELGVMVFDSNASMITAAVEKITNTKGD